MLIQKITTMQTAQMQTKMQTAQMQKTKMQTMHQARIHTMSQTETQTTQI